MAAKRKVYQVRVIVEVSSKKLDKVVDAIAAVVEPITDTKTRVYHWIVCDPVKE